MAAIVCHGLQSCMDSQLVESRIHRIVRLPSPKPQPVMDLAFNKSCFWESNTKLHCEEINSHKTNTTSVSSNSNKLVSSWSSIQSLSSNVTQDSTYVPKMSSWMRLSPKSLELCTENLGNETGSDSNIEDLFYLNNNSMELKEQSQVLGAKKVKKTTTTTTTKNFPPPLTTMRGSESLRVRPHREDGRLVIEVTKVPSSASCFQADRSNGRLRLCFWNDQQEFQTEDEEEDVEEEEEEGGFENTNTTNEIETRVGACCWIEAKYERVGRERGRRCKEEGEHENNRQLVLYMQKWRETLWVATS